MIRIVESELITQLKKQYIEFYCKTRTDQIPVEYTFLVTKMKFQDFIITLMEESPARSKEIVRAYETIKKDKTLQEKAIKIFQARAKRVLLG